MHDGVTPTRARVCVGVWGCARAMDLTPAGHHHHRPTRPSTSKHQVSTGKSTARPAAWHPGPGGHALRGRILAYHYLRLLDDALSDVYDAKVRWTWGGVWYRGVVVIKWLGG